MQAYRESEKTRHRRVFKRIEGEGGERNCCQLVREHSCACSIACGATVFAVCFAFILICNSETTLTFFPSTSAPDLPPTPYFPSDGWTYILEAVLSEPWPLSAYRFMSVDNSSAFVLSNGTDGDHQKITLFTKSDKTNPFTFRLQLHCGRFVSYHSTCSDLDLTTSVGLERHFRFASITNADVPFTWRLEAVDRIRCPGRFLSVYADGSLQLDTAATEFRLHPLRGGKLTAIQPNTLQHCADPFMWRYGEQFQLLCSGGHLPLLSSTRMASDVTFSRDGDALGGALPAWAAAGRRWAPENLESPADSNFTWRLCTFSVVEPHSGVHRVGWVMSHVSSQPLASSWADYAPTLFNLGNTPAGEIDPHVFRDPADGATYLLWKTDDNAVGVATTSILAQRIHVSTGHVELTGPRYVLLDSSGLWWAPSFVAGGSLIEAPELIYRGGWYYLFFSAGLYCEASYAEGVARSRHVLGPYSKLLVPVLSTGIMSATWDGERFVGPGHASIVLSTSASAPSPQARDGMRGGMEDKWFIVYHGHKASACTRHTFVSRMHFNTDGWPYVEMVRARENGGDRIETATVESRKRAAERRI